MADGYSNTVVGRLSDTHLWCDSDIPKRQASGVDLSINYSDFSKLIAVFLLYVYNTEQSGNQNA